MYAFRSKAYILDIYKCLVKHFGKVDTPLNYKTPEQLTVAVILSAQCTDERVNIVTKDLFKYCPDMFALNNTPLKKIEELVFSTGFYKNKAKNLKKLAHILVHQYNGKIPSDFSILVELPGIGRKTANVVMNVIFNKAVGIVVDTHVRRITQLLKMTAKETPETIEKDLMQVVPKSIWIDLPLYLIYLGRKFCIARKPKCDICILNQLCPSSSIPR